MFEIVVIKLEGNAQSHGQRLQMQAGPADYPQVKIPSI
jgi:hypothetical protein